ncbi:MAG: acyl-CoA/acyl-ACP dehydrogenase [Deltaproteobacteria bacterium]|nr:acyl-CoA/acyl-ACP dehydrogenase [Deltaproteobacteria bacterium]
MNTIKSGQSYSWISRFAIEHIASRADLYTARDFPHDLWQKMSEAGFFQIGITPEYGGTGGGFRQIAEAGEVFVRSGYNMGLALSWLYQQIIAIYLILGFGTEKQRKKYLPLMTQGRLIASFAVSEPKHGARPKLLTSTAVPDGNCYKINGEKTYLTNGPVAGLFIVIAITGEDQQQKKFSAFLVSDSEDGLSVSPQMKLDFLKSSPHGGVKLRDCRVPASSMLGEKDTAYTDIVIPFSDVENIVMMGAATGGMGAELMDVILEINARHINENKSLQSEVGELAALLETMRSIAREAAQKMDQKDSTAIPLTLIFNEMAEGFQSRMAAVVAKWDLKTSDRYNILQADLNILGMLSKKNIASKKTKIGDELLHGKR